MPGILPIQPRQSRAPLNKRPHERNSKRVNEDFESSSDEDVDFSSAVEEEYKQCEENENEEGCKRKVLIIARELFNHFGFHGLAAKIGAIKDDLDENEKKEKTDGGKTRHRKARNRKRTIKKKKRMKK